MKLDSTVIKDTTGMYTGFINQYPGVCTQADNIDQVKSNLMRNLKIYFSYVQKSGLAINDDQIFTL